MASYCLLYTSNREAVRALLEKRKVLFCMNGHDHGDGCTIINGIPYITLNSMSYIWHLSLIHISTVVTMVLLDVSKIFRGNLDLFYQLVGKNGALYDSTDVIDTFVFRSLLETSDIGMAASAGFYQSILCFATIMLVNGIVKRVQSDYALF